MSVFEIFLMENFTNILNFVCKLNHKSNVEIVQQIDDINMIDDYVVGREI